MQNLQGDIIQIVDANGAVVVEYTYDALCKVLSTIGSMANTLGRIQLFCYRGYVHDVEMELYYLESRYYKSGWGRFINADIVIENNTFAYTNNSPVKLEDPDGHDAFIITAEAAVGTMGHTSLLLQDSEGAWYYFYWGARNGHLVDAARVISDKVDIEVIDGVFIDLNKLNDEIGEYHNNGMIYTSAFYINGNFEKSLEFIESLEERFGSSDERVYELFTQNCMEVSILALSQSNIDSDLQTCLKEAYNRVIPSAAASIIRRKSKLPESRVDPLFGMYYVTK